MRRSILPLLLATLTSAAGGRGEAQSPHLLFVENTQGGDVSVIDGRTLTVVGTIPVGQTPEDIVAAPDGSVLYLSRIVRSASGRPTGTGEVVAIDPATRAVTWRANFHGSPNHLAVSPDGKRVFVTIVSGDWVDVVDPATHAMVDSITVGTGPHDIEVTADGRRLFVGLIRGTDVVEVEVATHRILRKIAVGDNVRPIALSSDERRLFVQLSRHHEFLVADPESGEVLRHVAMPVPEGKSLPATMPIDVNHGLRVTRDGKFLLANGSIVDETAIFALPSFTLVGTVPVGRDPNWITLSPDGSRAYVSNRGSDDVSVIDLRSRREIARIKVGQYPQRMAAVAIRGP